MRLEWVLNMAFLKYKSITYEQAWEYKLDSTSRRKMKVVLFSRMRSLLLTEMALMSLTMRVKCMKYVKQGSRMKKSTRMPNPTSFELKL